MLEHLKLFLGTIHQQMDNYLIRFRPGKCDFIATNGYAMCVNTLSVKHRFNGGLIAIPASEFPKILMFEGVGMEFDDYMKIGANGMFVPLEQLDNSYKINVDKILDMEPSGTEVNVVFSTKNFNLIAKYCKLMGTETFTQKFVGDKLPTIISGKGWKIYLMPMEEITNA